MANTPLLPSVKSLLNYADSATHTRSSSSQYHSKPSSRQDKHSRSHRPSSSSSSRYQNPQYLPSVHEVLHGVPSKQSHSSKTSYPTSERPDYKSRDSAATKKQGYPCERCGRLFTRKSDALKHIRVVHDRLKLFACSVCGRKFARKDYCTKHEKSLHNITPPPTQYQLRRQASKEQAQSRHRAMH